jgi:hypothetical protein
MTATKSTSAKFGTAEMFFPFRGNMDVTVRFKFERHYSVEIMSVTTEGETGAEAITNLTPAEERDLEDRIYEDLMFVWGPSFAKLDGTV